VGRCERSRSEQGHKDHSIRRRRVLEGSYQGGGDVGMLRRTPFEVYVGGCRWRLRSYIRDRSFEMLVRRHDEMSGGLMIVHGLAKVSDNFFVVCVLSWVWQMLNANDSNIIIAVRREVDEPHSCCG
jgi:hypothetical protein